MGGKASRDKGARFERQAANLLKELYPDARRGADQCRKGTDAPDVVGTPFWWEAKSGKRPNIMGAIEQAKAATDGRRVIAITKRDHGPILATIEIDFMLALLKAWEEKTGWAKDESYNGEAPEL